MPLALVFNKSGSGAWPCHAIQDIANNGKKEKNNPFAHHMKTSFNLSYFLNTSKASPV